MTAWHLFLALVFNTTWAFNFIAAKYGVEHFPPLLFTALRFAVLLALLAPFVRPVAGQMRPLLTVAFLLGALHFTFMFVGLAAAGDISSIAIVVQLYVPFSAILAALLLGERIAAMRVAGIAVSFAGVLVIGFDPIVFEHLDAALWVAAAALVMALATILMRRLEGVGVFTLQAWIAAVAVPVMVAASWLLESGQVAAMASATWLQWGSPVYSAVGASLVGHSLVYYLLRRYPVGVITPLTLLTPVLAVAFGVTLWGDELTAKLILGGLATLAGIAMVSVVGVGRR